MLQVLMHPDEVYRHSIWAVALALAASGVGAALLLEIAIGRVLPPNVRRRHNVLTVAILSIVGLTFSVLLAFVAMLAWDKFEAATASTSHEAALLLDLYKTASALPDPERIDLHASLVAYARAVREVEWPAQALGRAAPASNPALDRIDTIMARLHPQDIGAGNIQGALIAGLSRLRDVREERRTATESPIPSVIWFVVIAGGAITLTCAALLGTSNLCLHLVMTSLLSMSGVLVLVMIVALGNPFQGDLRVTPEAFQTIEQQMSGG